MVDHSVDRWINRPAKKCRRTKELLRFRWSRLFTGLKLVSTGHSARRKSVLRRGDHAIPSKMWMTPGRSVAHECARLVAQSAHRHIRVIETQTVVHNHMENREVRTPSTCSCRRCDRSPRPHQHSRPQRQRRASGRLARAAQDLRPEPNQLVSASIRPPTSPTRSTGARAPTSPAYSPHPSPAAPPAPGGAPRTPLASAAPPPQANARVRGPEPWFWPRR